MSRSHANAVSRPLRPLARPGSVFLPAIPRGLGSLFGLLVRWQERIDERSHLSRMSPHQLRDVGLTRRDVEYETAKPFWRV